MKKQTKKGVKYGWLEGGLVGAALGVGAGLLVESKAGQRLGVEIKHVSTDFYKKYMIPNIKKVEKIGEAEYKRIVAEEMKRYSKDKKLSETEVKRLTKEVLASWKHLKSNL